MVITFERDRLCFCNFDNKVGGRIIHFRKISFQNNQCSKFCYLFKFGFPRDGLRNNLLVLRAALKLRRCYSFVALKVHLLLMYRKSSELVCNVKIVQNPCTWRLWDQEEPCMCLHISLKERAGF